MDTTQAGHSKIEDDARVPRYVTAVWSADTRWNGRTERFDERTFDVGRGPELQDARMSRAHCRFVTRRGQAWLDVLRPSNGAFLDGTRLPSDASHPIEDGAVIRAGDTLFVASVEKPRYRFNRRAVIPGRTPAAMAADVYAARVARTDRHALIIGPSGAGKENVARQMHMLGPRAETGDLHRFDCTTLRRGAGMSSFFGVEGRAFTDVQSRAGLLEGTDAGTVFLDEIGDLVPEAEARLLRLIATGDYERHGGSRTLHTDARFIGATLRDVRSAEAMRSDLFHRFTAFQQPIEVPGLADRLIDLVDWVAVLSADVEGASTLTAGWVETCLLWDWPGNLRELSSQLHTARLRTEPSARLTADLLSAELRKNRVSARDAHPPSPTRPTGPISDEQLVECWEASGHNISETARLTGLSRRTVRRRLKELGLL